MQNISPKARRTRYASTRGCEKSKCPSGVHANENCGINFAADVGQIVDDEDSCEITRNANC